MFPSASAPTRSRHDRHTQNSPVSIDIAKDDVLEPVSLYCGRPGGSAPTSDDPHCREITLLPEVGSENPDIEVLRLDAPKPTLQDAERRIYGYCLTVVGWSTGSDRPGIGSIVPEE